VKRIYLCIGIFISVIAFSVFCQFYITNTVEQMYQLLNKAAESRIAGDYPASREYADSALKKWRGLTKRSSYILADLTIAADVTVSLSRVAMTARTDDSNRFLEECAATILMLEHFLAYNNNFLDGND
jgi:hypothetical protein